MESFFAAKELKKRKRKIVFVGSLRSCFAHRTAHWQKDLQAKKVHIVSFKNADVLVGISGSTDGPNYSLSPFPFPFSRDF